MFGVPIELIKKGNPEYALRQRGKVAELALGYGGGVSAMRTMDTGKILADEPDEAIMELVRQWRATSPWITEFWRNVENAAMKAINTGEAQAVYLNQSMDQYLRFSLEAAPSDDLTYLVIQLPNKRKLYYAKPFIAQNRFGRPSIGYWNVDQTSRKWGPTETYGGKLAENITQAVARDCLAEAIERLEAAGYPVVFHVHDEVVIETEDREGVLDDVVAIMSQVPAWAAGLPLGADGWVDRFYKKD